MLYKLTDDEGRTYGGCQWGEGIEHTAAGTGDLCTHGWIHAYTDPLLAVLLNPIHAHFANPRLWEAEGEVGKTDHGLKVGCTQLRTVREIPLPGVTTEQRVRFGILAAQAVCRDPAFGAWAVGWLTGADRSIEAADRTLQAFAARAGWAAAVLDLSTLAQEAME